MLLGNLHEAVERNIILLTDFRETADLFFSVLDTTWEVVQDCLEADSEICGGFHQW